MIFPVKDFPGIIGEGDLRLLPRLDEGQLVLVDLAEDPDPGEVGDLVQVFSGHDLLALKDVLLDHDP